MRLGKITAILLLICFLLPCFSLAETMFIFDTTDIVKKTIVVSSGIKVYLNNVEINLTDSNGNKLEAFRYNEITYLPIIELANVLGKEALWNENTQSIYLQDSAISSVFPTTIESIPLSDLEINAQIAIQFIKDRLKNPNSLQINNIYGYFTDYSKFGIEGMPIKYEYAIDCSAQNGFGGYSRDTHYVRVEQGIPELGMGKMFFAIDASENIDIDRLPN